MRNFLTSFCRFIRRNVLEAAGIVLVVVSVFLLAHSGSGGGGKEAQGSSSTNADGAEIQNQSTLAPRRQEALRAIRAIHAARSQEVNAAISLHLEKNTRVDYQRLLDAEFVAARKQVPELASFLLSPQGNWEIGRALWDRRLNAYLGEVLRHRLLDEKKLQEKVNDHFSQSRKELERQLLEINKKHNIQLSALLSSLDREVRHLLPVDAVNLPAPSHLPDSVLKNSAGRVALTLGTTMISAKPFQTLAGWLGPRLGIQAGSKVLRFGTGPVGWAVALVVGFAVEEAVSHYYLHPHLERQLQAFLDQARYELLIKSDLPGQIAATHASWARQLSPDSNEL